MLGWDLRKKTVADKMWLLHRGASCEVFENMNVNSNAHVMEKHSPCVAAMSQSLFGRRPRRSVSELGISAPSGVRRCLGVDWGWGSVGGDQDDVHQGGMFYD